LNWRKNEGTGPKCVWNCGNADGDVELEEEIRSDFLIRPEHRKQNLLLHMERQKDQELEQRTKQIGKIFSNPRQVDLRGPTMGAKLFP